MRFFLPAPILHFLLCADGAAAGDQDNLKLAHVPALGGVPTDCVHAIPLGAHLRAPRDAGAGGGAEILLGHQVVAMHPPCSLPPRTLRHGPAWKAWTEATVHADDEILALAGQWKVPDEPNSIGLSILLYLWNGVEPCPTIRQFCSLCCNGVQAPRAVETTGRWGCGMFRTVKVPTTPRCSGWCLATLLLAP